MEGATDVTPEARYSKVSRRIWNDAGFRKLSSPAPNAQTLWLRLLTGPELSNIPGVIMAWEAGLAQALRWPVDGFRKVFREVIAEGLAKADWEAGLIWIPNAIKHNRPASPNVVTSWAPTWDLVPECELKEEAYQELKAFLEGMHEGFAKAFGMACAKPCPNQDQDQEQDQDPLFEGCAPPPPDKPTSRPTRATRLPADWQPSAATLKRFSDREHVDATVCVERFRNHWVAKSGRDATKFDWEATFVNWVLEDIDRGRAKPISAEPPETEPRGLFVEYRADGSKLDARTGKPIGEPRKASE